MYQLKQTIICRLLDVGASSYVMEVPGCMLDVQTPSRSQSFNIKPSGHMLQYCSASSHSRAELRVTSSHYSLISSWVQPPSSLPCGEAAISPSFYSFFLHQLVDFSLLFTHAHFRFNSTPPPSLLYPRFFH